MGCRIHHVEDVEDVEDVEEVTVSTIPVPRRVAAREVGRCVVSSLVMLGRREVCQPRVHVGRRIHFADGTSARVYRETAAFRTPRCASSTRSRRKSTNAMPSAFSALG